MNKAHKRMGMALILAIVALMMIPVFQPLPHAQTKDKPKTTQKRKKQQKKTDDIFADPTDMRPMTGRYYLYPSETKRKYPDLRKYKNVWFKVPISKYRQAHGNLSQVERGSPLRAGNDQQQLDQRRLDPAHQLVGAAQLEHGRTTRCRLFPRESNRS